MVRQLIRWVIGGAERADIELLQQPLRRVLWRSELRVGALPNRLRTVFVQQFIDAEVALEF